LNVIVTSLRNYDQRAGGRSKELSGTIVDLEKNLGNANYSRKIRVWPPLRF
jgi:hypothetical protein